VLGDTCHYYSGAGGQIIRGAKISERVAMQSIVVTREREMREMKER
jgi:hypothetical protein